MLPVIFAASSAISGASSLASSVPGLGSVMHTISGLGGGAARDASRKARFDGYMALAAGGSVDAARLLYGGVRECKSPYELNLYKDGVARMEAQNPSLMERARALGAQWDGSTDDNPTALESALSRLATSIRNDVSTTVQQIGAGATNAASQAIAAPGTAQSRSVLVPGNWAVIGVIVVALIVGAILLRKGR